MLNFVGNFLKEIIRILERNEKEAKAHPPTPESALKKLKWIFVSEKYWKKTKKVKIELPSFCSWLDDIELLKEKILLLSGHTFIGIVVLVG